MAGKIAILTDIHGNAPALRAALADIDRQPGIAWIYCLGDMISIGHENDAVMALLCARPNLTMLAGNHEDAVLALAEGKDPGVQGEELTHMQWVTAHLDPQYIPILSRLPHSLTPVHHGKEFLLLHYHLDPQGHFAPVDRQPSLEKLEEMYRRSTAAAVCFGHHHPRHDFRSPKRIYINPGSLGCCERPVARYAVLDAAGARSQVKVQMREVPYDIRAFLAGYEVKQVPARAFILAAFHGGQPGLHIGPPAGEADHAWLASLWRREWGGESMVTRGRTHHLADLQAALAWDGGQRVGAVTYRLEGPECEVLSLNALERGAGIGSTLLLAAEAAAQAAGCRRTWLVTSNDNLDALRFYQRRGYRLAAVHPGAVDAARQVKPSIPRVGLHGIPLHDEIELEKAPAV